MSLDDLLKKQQEEEQAFARARQIAWDRLNTKHEANIAAMGGEDNLTREQQKQRLDDIAAFHKEWSADGRLNKETTKKHVEERLNNASGTDAKGREERKKQMLAEQMKIVNRQKQGKQISQSPKASTANENANKPSNKEERIAQMVAEQKAILERTKIRKRTR